MMPREASRPAARGRILLSFDCEEFDLPNEFGHAIGFEQQVALGAQGLERVLELLADCHVPATMFTTGTLARACPTLIREVVAEGHELASHGLRHTGYEPDDLQRSRDVLEEVGGSAVTGFRRPRFQRTGAEELLAAGYRYDSSMHPTLVPGRYNGLRDPRLAHWEDALLRIPLSVTPRIRWPVFWLAFKNVPMAVTRAAVERILEADGYCALCFHPWELLDLRPYAIPGYVRRVDGQRMIERLREFLEWLQGRATVGTYGAFFDSATQQPRMTGMPLRPAATEGRG